MSGITNWALGLISNWYRGGPRQVGGTWFYPVDFDPFAKIKYLECFNEIPELNAVINWKARAFCSGVIYRIDKDGNRLPDDNFTKLINRPNWFQAGKEFLRQTKLFREIYGDEYLYSWRGVTKTPIDTKAFYTLPPNLVTCIYDDATPFFMESAQPDGITYTYKLGSKETNLPIDQLLHLNDNRVTITEATKKSMLNGESKMRGLTPAINNIRMAYETRGVILKRRGAMGVLSNDGADVSGQIPMEKGERDDLQEQYRRFGGLEGQDNIIITNTRVRWQNMTVSPDKMGLFQETEEDFYKICDGYGVDMALFSAKNGVTYQNQNAAEKRTYDNTVIPEANEWIGALDYYFYGDITDGSRLIMDFSHLAIYQEDLELNARGLGVLVAALSTALADKAITIDEYQQEMARFGLSVGNKPQDQ